MSALPTAFTAEQYLLEDYRHTLFPLSTTKLLVERFASELRQYAAKTHFDHKLDAQPRNEGFICAEP